VSIPPGSDTPPADPSSAAASAKHAPWPSEHQGYAPQRADRAKLYDVHAAAPAKARTLEGALLACKVSTRVKGDRRKGSVVSFLLPHTRGKVAAPDLLTVLTFGKGPSLTAWGPDNSQSMYITAPAVHLRQGQPVEAKLYDREVVGRERLGVVRGKYPGRVPFEIKRGAHTLSCRQVSPAALTHELSEALAGADRALRAAAASATPHRDRHHWGLSGLSAKTRKELEPAAALLGWGDPRVRRRLRWRAEIVSKAHELPRRWIAELSESLPLSTAGSPATLKGSGLQVELGQQQCGDKVFRRYKRHASVGSRSTLRRSRCVVTLTITHRGEGPLKIDTHMGKLGEYFSLAFVLADGTTVGARTVSMRRQPSKRWKDQLLQPGQSATLALTPAQPLPFGESEGFRTPVLLVLYGSMGESTDFIRLR